MQKLSTGELFKYAKMVLDTSNIEKFKTKKGVKMYDLKTLAFVKYLIKGKTMGEIKQKFGKDAKKLLKKKYEGLWLANQRDEYNRQVFILLPEVSEKIHIQDKAWKYHVGKDENGEEQPYLVVQLPNFEGKLKIGTLFDVHYGSHAHRKEKFLSYIRWIKETPNVYAILGGDLMENAIDDGRGMTYDQNVNPNSQFSDMVKLLAPIAHKILVAVPGNHEARTEKKTGFDLMKALADRLKIPYFSGPVLMTVLANGYKWNFYVRHGTGNSQTKGGKMNMAARPKQWTGIVHFFVSGHVHDCIAESETMMVDDPLNCRLVYLKQWVVIAPSFLSWYKTYAYRAEYKPSSMGGVAMELFDNGKYKASLTE